MNKNHMYVILHKYICDNFISVYTYWMKILISVKQSGKKQLGQGQSRLVLMVLKIPQCKRTAICSAVK